MGGKEWRKALDLSRAIAQCDDEEVIEWMRRASLLVMAEDIPGYERLCNEMLERCRGTNLAVEAGIATKVGLLIPGIFDIV